MSECDEVTLTWEVSRVSIIPIILMFPTWWQIAVSTTRDPNQLVKNTIVKWAWGIIWCGNCLGWGIARLYSGHGSRIFVLDDCRNTFRPTLGGHPILSPAQAVVSSRSLS